ncbi:type IV secretory system conjugative DNA transfer family protein [Aliarcobacter thereius]|uniref:Type IV secretory system conjugative DNA transfer family protein n=1 Tax=Aliarcobacter thereius TaxID=544718 RepID=A0A5R9GXT3_9BACT|nr:type IV secretory system conjugative DNA transfer family protein [Aliarcobacter thereius]TLS71061.1 type IV secretory system conjugative DNA transfer family protein [Aliarcobacter thereius]TLT06665.1 type IV secretory system conjugative DNA transfer family protein [Aliarcobacter thereius]
MRIFFLLLASILFMILTLGFGLYQQFGTITNLPPIEVIIELLKAQHPSRPSSFMILSVFIAITIFIPIGILLSLFGFKANNEYGSSRFANNKDIKKFKLNCKSGIILGKYGFNFLRSEEPLSTLCVAPPGTGKTAGFVIPNALAYEQSLFVLDIKGEISDNTSKYRSSFSNVIIFEPASITNEFGFNPLDDSIIKDFDQNELNQHILQVAELLFKDKKNSTMEEHWNLEAKNLFIFFTIFLIYEKSLDPNKNPSISIPYIRSFILRKEDLLSVIKEILNTYFNLPTLAKELANALVQKADKEFSGLFSTFQTKMIVFQDSYIAKSLSFNSFTPEQFRKENTSLYFKINEIDIERLSPLVRLTLDFFVKSLLKKEKQKDDLNILFLLDEFPRFGSIPVLLKLPAIGRSYGLLSMFFFQSNGQITEIYQRHGMEELDSTTAYKIILTLNEHQTAKSFSDSIGNTTRIKKGVSKSKSENFLTNNGSSSSSQNLEGVPLVKAEDLLSLSFGEAIVIVQGYRTIPIKAKTPFYFKNKQMLKAIKESK